MSETVFQRFQKHGVPLVDTADSLLTRILDVYEAGRNPVNQEQQMKGRGLYFEPDSPPDLTHTSVRQARIDNDPPIEASKLFWNSILLEVIRLASKKIGVPKVTRALSINWVEGHGPADKGYRFIEEANISVQGQDSNACWKAIRAVSRAANMHVQIKIAWQDKPEASFPAQSGRLSV